MDNIILTTGGTGGHIFPALAVAEELRRRNPSVNLLFVGSLYGPEERLTHQAGVPFVGLPVRGLLGRGVKAIGAGALMARLLRFCAVNGLSGLEGLVGIPGSVGGAVAMNAGSHGTETGKNLVGIQVVIDNTIQCINAGALQYGYRSMCINGKKNDFIVLEATFGLTVAERDGICNCMSPLLEDVSLESA